ncbi:MAG TPA: NAD(P)-dependent oxidoreductase [Euzebyales bacterium]|nr:NAD(P)-dependent oxidoreductase [Euzebyales bacterium]
MRIFVAGATGVLGRRVVPGLIAAGHDVDAVARNPAKAEQLRTQGASPIAVDLFDAAAVATAVRGSDAVVNLATAIPPMGRMLRRSAWEMTDRLRTDASRNLVDAALATGARRYVQEALGFVYPDRGSAWIDEDTALAPAPFARAVLSAEAEARRFGADGGTGIALRFGLFYSADSEQTRQIASGARGGWLALPGRGDAYRPWVHVDDAATAVVVALDAPGGVYNVVDDHPLTNDEHASVLGELVGRRLRRPPSWLAVGPLRLLTRSLRVSNRRLRDATGWRPAYASLREGWDEVLARLGAVTAGV